MDMFDGTISLDVAMENATETLPVKGVMFHEGYGKGPKLKPDATSNLNDIFGVEFAKQPTPLPAARPQGAKFAVFAEEEEEPAAKPKGGKKFAVFAEEAEPAAKPPAKPKGGKK